MDKRPILNKQIAVKDFQDFYWLKAELTKFCREEGLKTTGNKIEITQRIIHYLETGEKQISKERIQTAPKSRFDWNNEKLTLETIITDSYKNTENVRTFFEREIGNQFRFNVKFMNWMKSNSGKTLEDSIEAWKIMKAQSKKHTKPKEIAPQFEYNRYLRDFLADNPGMSRDIGIKLWNIKKSMRGDNKYTKEDLEYLNR